MNVRMTGVSSRKVHQRISQSKPSSNVWLIRTASGSWTVSSPLAARAFLAKARLQSFSTKVIEKIMNRTQKRRAFVNVVIIIVGLGLCSFIIKQVWSSRKGTPRSQAAVNSSLGATVETQKEARILKASELNDILGRRQQQVMVLDIQERKKFREGHIPSAINIPSDELEARAEDELSKSDLIIIVDCACDGTNTVSLIRHSTLVTLGFSNVAVLDEGLNAWKRSSFEIVVEKE